MAEVVRPLGYTGGMQRYTATTGGTITAYLWGGGGGGGEQDGGRPGGTGSGGNYSAITFTVAPGDVIDVAVGGGGGPGTGSRLLIGGDGGASYQPVMPLWSTLNLIGPAYRPTPPLQIPWSQFVRNWGIWSAANFGYGETPDSILYDQTFFVPTTAVYQFRAGAANNQANFYIDPGPGTNWIQGATAYLVTSGGDTKQIDVLLTAGTHVIRTFAAPADRTDGGAACTIWRADGVFAGYSGAPGGSSGDRGSSGSGGGSGGATVLLKNGSVIAVAGGGAGGGGAGLAYRPESNAPGWAVRAAAGINAGMRGEGRVNADGGGGGAGGGGYGGGDGNEFGSGDSSGLAGATGGNLGPTTAEATGQQPPNAGSAFRFGTPGLGGNNGTGTGQRAGAGTAGQATFVFDVVGSFVKTGGVWTPVQETFIKDQGVWKSVQEQYVKQNGEWRLVSGTNASAPTFTGVAGNFGVSDRPYTAP